MKSKLLWIPFIPAVIAMTAFRVLSIFGNDDTGMIKGIDELLFSYLAVGVALVLFVLGIFFNILDRKTAPVYEVKRNIPAGVFSVLSAAFVLAYSVITLYAQKGSEYFIVYLVCTFLALLAAIGLILMSRTHFTGYAPVSNVAILYVFPSLWAVSELVSCFLQSTKLSVSASDMSLLFCFIFLTLSLFPLSMVVSKIPGRNPVKATFIYGLPSAAFGVSYGVFLIGKVTFDSIGGMALITGLMLLSFAFYQIFFIIELTRGALNKDEVQIIDSTYEDDNKSDKVNGKDELVFSDDGNADDDYAQKATPDTDDFIMGYESEDDVVVAPAPKIFGEEEKDISGGFFFGVDNEEKSMDEQPDDTKSPSFSSLEERRQKKEEKLMSEIDKLLAELEEHQG